MAAAPAGWGKEVPKDVSTKVSLEIACALGSCCGAGEDGSGPRVRDAAIFGDPEGDYVVHPVGRHLAFRHRATGSANYVDGGPEVDSISACGFSHDRSLLAVCERWGPAPLGSNPKKRRPKSQVSVYSLKSNFAKPQARLTELGGVLGVFASVAFSTDERLRFLVLATTPPPAQENPVIVVVDWRRNYVVGRCELPGAADRVSFSPLEGSCLAAATGPDFVRFWAVDAPSVEEMEAEEAIEAIENRVASNAGSQAGSRAGSRMGSKKAPAEDEVPELRLLEELPESKDLKAAVAVFGDHAWLLPADGTLAACTAEGPVIIIAALGGGEAAHILRTIEAPFRPPVGGAVARCIRCYEHGLLLGGDESALALWERAWSKAMDEDLEAAAGAFEHVRTVQVRQGTAAIGCLDMAGGLGEERLLFGFLDGDIGHVPLASLTAAEEEEQEPPVCELLCGGFHAGAITSLDLATHRTLAVTASRSECSVRVWNYLEQRCELAATFKGEEPTGVAIHPFGYYIAISFESRLRFMQVLMDELKPYRDLVVRSIRFVKFANGGHLLIAAQGKMVLVFNSVTLARVATLRGHPQPVCAACFSPDDATLQTLSEEGTLLEWSTKTWLRIGDSIIKGEAGVHSLAVGEDGRSCVGMIEDKVTFKRTILRSFVHCKALDEDKEFAPHLQLSALCQHHGVAGVSVLAADSAGAIWTGTGLVATPASKQAGMHKLIPTWQEHGFHAGACSAICLTPDARTLATAGEDGALFVLRVEGLAGGKPPVARDAGQEEAQEEAQREVQERAADQVVMINQGDLALREEEVLSLAAEAASLQAQINEDADRVASETAERVAEARKEDQEEIRQLRAKCEALQHNATAQERETLRVLKTMEASHVQAADQLESDYDKKFRREAERFGSLETDLDRMADRLEGIRADAQQQLENQRRRQKAEQEQRMAEKAAEIQKLKDLVKFSQHRFNTMLDQECMEHELEAAELRKKNDALLEQQRAVEQKLKKEQDTLLRGLGMTEKDRERLGLERDRHFEEKKALSGEVERLQAEVNGMKQERQEREAMLREKELAIGGHKAKVNTLKKFKSVLDFRLREVTSSLQPKDDMIKQLTEQHRELEAEFERQLEEQRKMEGVIEGVAKQIEEKAAEGKRLREVAKLRDGIIFRFTEDLRLLATEEQDMRRWPQGILKIYRDHVDPKRLTRNAGGFAIEELARQICSVEQKAETLAVQTKLKEETGRGEIRGKMQENSQLLRELEELRADKVKLHKKVKDLELRIRQAEYRKLGPPGQQAALANKAGAYPPEPLDTRPDPMNGTLRRPLVHKGHGDKKLVMKVLADADVTSQQIQMQRLEQKLLSDQLARLQQATGMDSGGGAPAAGHAMAAVRQAGSSPTTTKPGTPPGTGYAPAKGLAGARSLLP